MPSFFNILVVGIGGFIGAILRYLLSGLTGYMFNLQTFPLGTAVINVLGSLVIGLLAGWGEHVQPFGENTQLLVFIGVLGSFTTFSTFSLETVLLMKNGAYSVALTNVLIQLTLGFTAVFIGYNLTKGF